MISHSGHEFCLHPHWQPTSPLRLSACTLFKCPNALCSNTSHMFALFVFPVLFGWVCSGTLKSAVRRLAQTAVTDDATNKWWAVWWERRRGGWNRRRWKHEKVTRWIWSGFMSLSRELLIIVYLNVTFYLFFINICYILYKMGSTEVILCHT